jgi:glycosyltransferase involved in cell wall biosynthesis
MDVIAYIAGEFPLRSETFVYREVRELRRRGRTVVCVTLNPPHDPPPGDDDLVRGRLMVYGFAKASTLKAAMTEMGRHPLRALRTLWKAKLDALLPGESMSVRARLKLPMQAVMAIGLARRLRQRGVTHIHAHFAHAPTSIAMYAATQLGQPFSFTGHANDLFHRRALLKRKLGRAKFVGCISAWHRTLYESICGRSRDDYPVIRCGVDTSEFSPKGGTGAHGPMRVLTVGRLVEKKGMDTLIRALGALDASATKWSLTIAGDGPQRARLEALVDELKVRDAVRFLGAVDNDTVRGLLTEHEVFALPCRVDSVGDKDGIPVVLMEAMASGLPVVSGDLDAIRELIQHEESGLLVDGTRVEPTRDALARLAADPALRVRLGSAGRQRVIDEFSLETNVSRLEAAIGITG